MTWKCWHSLLANYLMLQCTFQPLQMLAVTLNKLDGTFGFTEKEVWKPWRYETRINVAKQVGTLKKSLAKKQMAASTRWSKITSFIAQKHSRQEFEPVVGKLIDRAHVDPLHLKNNGCAWAHQQLLNEVIAMSKLTDEVNSFSQVPAQSPFNRYIVATCMPKCGLSRLAKKVTKWFDKTKANGKSFDYRFTGKDSRLFLLHFMSLISAIECSANAHGRGATILHVIACVCLCLRDCVSLFSRLNRSDEQVSELKTLCTNYFRANAIFFYVNPTVWTIGHLVPAHTKYMKGKYGLGLGLNSMEGREAKHVFISKYSQNTMFHSRWEQIFLHEFVSLLWLRERGYNCSNVNSSTVLYSKAGDQFRPSILLLWASEGKVNRWKMQCALKICGPKLCQVLRRERTCFRSLFGTLHGESQSNKIHFHVQFVLVIDTILFRCIPFVAK